VTVAGVNDADPANETVSISHTIVGSDYAGVTSANVTATVTDDDFIASVTITFNSLTYITVQSPDTSRVWLDRNLGATQVATSSTDAAAYGGLYQWGRAADGHESRSSGSTTTLATTITPGTSTFITNTVSPHDWTSADSNGSSRTGAWADGGANDICPGGFSVPTEAEITADTMSATTTDVTNTTTAFSSFLKIPAAGTRNAGSGGIYALGTHARWQSRSAGRYMSVTSNSAAFYTDPHSYGFSVRCIKD
jgi:uncharacterized protein (TIGR02145 family)